MQPLPLPAAASCSQVSKGMPHNWTQGPLHSSATSWQCIRAQMGKVPGIQVTARKQHHLCAEPHEKKVVQSMHAGMHACRGRH
jgi:hypothetical protein